MCPRSYAFGGIGPVGERLWRWKDKIDRKWMKMYQEMPDMKEEAIDASLSRSPPARPSRVARGSHEMRWVRRQGRCHRVIARDETFRTDSDE